MQTSVSKLIGYESNTMASVLSSGIKKTRVEVPSLLLTNHVSLRSSLKCLYSIIYKLRVILVPTTVKVLRAEKVISSAWDGGWHTVSLLLFHSLNIQLLA